MALIIVLVLLVIFDCTRLADNGREMQYEKCVARGNEWVKSVTDDNLERRILFELTDVPQTYENELNDAYKEIEKNYVQSIQPVYVRYVNDAASRGEDKREYWKKEMLIDASSQIFNLRLKTNVNKLRILLAKRGYLRKEDAREGSYMNLKYTNPVEGVVIAWCANELRKQGRAGQLLMRRRWQGSNNQDREVAFELFYAGNSIGWNFF